MESIKDIRAPNHKDVPYSAYCEVCWRPVWRMDLSKEPFNGECVEKQTDPMECQNNVSAINWGSQLKRAIDEEKLEQS